jgi:hypothetical protein
VRLYGVTYLVCSLDHRDQQCDFMRRQWQAHRSIQSSYQIADKPLVKFIFVITERKSNPSALNSDSSLNGSRIKQSVVFPNFLNCQSVPSLGRAYGFRIIRSTRHNFDKFEWIESLKHQIFLSLILAFLETTMQFQQYPFDQIDLVY